MVVVLPSTWCVCPQFFFNKKTKSKKKKIKKVSKKKKKKVKRFKKCCECMRWDLTYTHVFCARRRAAGFVSHMFTHALTVCTQGMILIN